MFFVRKYKTPDEFLECGAVRMTLPAGVDTRLKPPTILVCNLLMSAVHEEVTAVAFHGHAYSKVSQIFVSQQFGMAVTQVSHERIPLGVIERSCFPLRKELPAVALPR